MSVWKLELHYAPSARHFHGILTLFWSSLNQQFIGRAGADFVTIIPIHLLVTIESKSTVCWLKFEFKRTFGDDKTPINSPCLHPLEDENLQIDAPVNATRIQL